MLLWATAGGAQPRGSCGGVRGGAPHPGCRVRSFWSQYAQLLPGEDEALTLLMWDEGELLELQDPQLMQDALSWQKTVAEVHVLLVSGRDVAADDSLAAYKLAVAAVESRAFGVRGAHGVELQAMVPYLDLANHNAESGCWHGLGGREQQQCFELRSGSPSAGSGSGEAEDTVEVSVSYGAKDNRALMHQYGFSTPGNPRERPALLPPGAPLPPRHVSRKAVTAAAARLRQRCSGGGGDRAAVAALAARAQCAAAAVLACVGWRSFGELRGVSRASTSHSAGLLLAGVRQQLASFRTTAAQDLSQLQQLQARGGGLPTPSGDEAHPGDCNPSRGRDRRAMAALQYRREVKLQLLAAEQLLLELMSSA